LEKGVSLSNVFALIALENRMSLGVNGQISKMVEQFMQHESNNSNMFGVVAAITRTGQLYDPTEWVRFDEIAGKLTNYTDNQWTGFQARAKAMDKVTFDKAYGIVAAA
jgi:hypothetical protein